MNRDYNTLEEKFLAAPDDIQIALGSQDVLKKLDGIAKKHSLDENSTEGLIEETTLVMLGVTHASEFIKDVSEHLGITAEKSAAIAKDINEEIFQLVKESLKIVHNITDETAPTTPVPPKPPAPPGAPFSFPQMIVPPKINLEIPPIPPQPSQNIFEQKLQGVFKMPKEETLVPPKTFSHEDVRAIPPSAGFSQKPSSSPTPPAPPRAGGVDPYREPPK